MILEAEAIETVYGAIHEGRPINVETQPLTF